MAGSDWANIKVSHQLSVSRRCTTLAGAGICIISAIVGRRIMTELNRFRAARRKDSAAIAAISHQCARPRKKRHKNPLAAPCDRCVMRPHLHRQGKVFWPTPARRMAG